MSKPTLEEKQAFAAKVRARNYAASLRLEGIKPVTDIASSKESLLQKYRSRVSQRVGTSTEPDLIPIVIPAPIS